MKEFEKIRIETMEMVLLCQYKELYKEQSFDRQEILKVEKDAMIATLAIMGYMVTCDVDTDLKLKAVHIRKL